MAQSSDNLTRDIQAVLDRMRPAIRADGGDVELVDIVDDTVRVRLKGACVGCPSSSLTLHLGIERAVRASIPSVKRVVAVA
jgi:Fe-S cluster biogenesis protein NfuA